jgi:hypothetical protein
VKAMIEAIFRDAAELDVALSLDGDRIHYRGWISEDLKQRIVVHRADVIAALELRAAIDRALAVFPGADVVGIRPHVDDGQPLPRIDLDIPTPPWLTPEFIAEKLGDTIRRLPWRLSQPPDPKKARWLVESEREGNERRLKDTRAALAKLNHTTANGRKQS